MSRRLTARVLPAALVLAVGVGFAVIILPNSQAHLWLTLLWFTWVLGVLWAWTRRSFPLPFATASAVLLLFVVLPATADVARNQARIAGLLFDGGLVTALQISTVANVGLLAGAIVARGSSGRPRPLRFTPRISIPEVDRLARLAAIVAVFGIIGNVVVSGTGLGNVSALTSSFGYGGGIAGSSSGFTQYLFGLQGAAGVALMLVVLRFVTTRANRRLAIVIAAGLALMLVIQGQRASLFVPAIGCMLLWWKFSGVQRVKSRLIFTVVVLLAVVLAALVGVARGGAGRTFTIGSVKEVTFGSGSDLFTPIAGLALTVPRVSPYSLGATYLDVLVFPVPRALWHSKPQGHIVDVVDKFGGTLPGIAFPESGEMYANFGLPGVGVGMLVMGLALELLWKGIAEGTSVGPVALRATMCAVIIDILTRGDVASIIGSLAGFLVAAVLCFRANGRLSQTEGAVEPEPVSGRAAS